MLSDPILLANSAAFDTTISDLGSFNEPLALVASPQSGVTKRTNVHDDLSSTTLTISRSESKENAPYVTNRTVQRFDQTKVDSLGKKVTLSCYVVIAAPLSSLFTQEDVVKHVRSACVAAAYGGVSDTGTIELKTDNTHLSRVLEGEQ